MSEAFLIMSFPRKRESSYTRADATYMDPRFRGNDMEFVIVGARR